MANALPPGFQGLDFSQWNSWQPITIDGLPYYTIPGHPQYVFDPYDGAYGSIKINPQHIEATYNAENPEPGLADQIAPALGTLGGAYVANELFGSGTTTANAAGESGGFFSNLFGTGGGSEAVGATLGDSAALAQGTELGASMLASSGFDPATASVESIFAQPGQESMLGSIAPYAGLVGAGLGAYGIHNAIEADDPKAGAMSGAGLGLGLGAAAPLAGFGPLGWGALGLMALGGAGLGAGLTGALMHESTRERAMKNTKTLQKQGKEDPVWQNYVQGMRAQFDKAPPDPSKPYAGKYKNWNEYKAAGLEANDLSGVYGNLKTFGPQWAHLTQEQRVAVTQGLINADLYKSKKGDVEITDADKAKTIFDAVISGQEKPQVNSNGSNEDMKRKQKEPMRMGVPLAPIPQRQMPNPVGQIPQRQMPQTGSGGVPQGAQKGVPNANSFGQSIANQMRPQVPQQAQSMPPQVQQQLQRPSAQPQTDTADWMMKLRQRALAPQMPAPMPGLPNPNYRGY